MTTTFLPFAKPALDDAEFNEVLACMRSGWLTTGPRTQQFENMLQSYFASPHALALNSATAGLHLVLLGLALQPGDEVITTPLTFVATLNTIVQAGAKPVLVDIDETYNIDLAKLEEAITPRTRAIVPVHFTGLPVDLDEIYRLAKQYSLRVVEDCAHAIGSGYKNKRVGSFGDIQVFSFHPNKNMTTGEGGCVVTRDGELAEQVRIMRFHGIARDAFNRFTKEGSPHYDVVAPGFKYNMLDMQAALGLHQLPKLESLIEKRKRLVERYYDLLAGWSTLILPKLPTHYDYQHAWHLFAPLIKVEHVKLTRDDCMARMKAHDIGVGLHYQAAHLFSFYQKTYGYREGDFPHAEYVSERIMSLPLFPDMTDADQDRVITALEQVIGRT